MPKGELQCCPNCGCEASLYKTKRRRWLFSYTCGGCWTATDLYDTPEAAERAWNALEKRERYLLPCPFCGGDVTVESDHVDAQTEVYRFICGECGMNTYFDGTSNDEALARETWNRRV